MKAMRKTVMSDKTEGRVHAPMKKQRLTLSPQNAFILLSYKFWLLIQGRLPNTGPTAQYRADCPISQASVAYVPTQTTLFGGS